MTNKEAIEKLKKLKEVMDLYTVLNRVSSNEPFVEALGMSIEALEKIDKETESYKDEVKE